MSFSVSVVAAAARYADDNANHYTSRCNRCTNKCHEPYIGNMSVCATCYNKYNIHDHLRAVERVVSFGQFTNTSAYEVYKYCRRIVLKDAFARLRTSLCPTQSHHLGPISLLLRVHATLNERCAVAAQEGDFLEAHKCQQQVLGISLAMCGIASVAAAQVALEAAKASKQVIELASITSRKMKLELELGKVIAGPYTNFALECDFTKCAELQAEIYGLCALINGPVILQQKSCVLTKTNSSASVKAKLSQKKARVADEMYHHAMGGWR